MSERINLAWQKKILEEKLKEIDKKIESKSKIRNEGKTKYYLFRQNNSYGNFEENENVSVYVFIEACNAEQANLLADNIGIYFNGCDMGIDCSCCGDRWREVDESDGYDKLEIYGKDINEMYQEMFAKRVIIYFLNGNKKIIELKSPFDGHKHDWDDRGYGKQCKICKEWESVLKFGEQK